MVDDSQALAQRLSKLLSGSDSAHRARINALVVDAILAGPTSSVLGDPELPGLIVSGLTEDTARAVVVDAIRPAFDRIRGALEPREDTVGDLLPESAPPVIAELIARGEGPRFGWLRGAIDPALIRQLFAPVVQDTLLAFAQRLPLPGMGNAGGAGGGVRGGGFVGGFARQVSRSAGQLADLGKGVMGGLGAELERRMQSVARDFSQTAMSQWRGAVRERLRSQEGRAILARMREQATAHVLATPAREVVEDFMHLPADDIAALIPSIVDHNRVHDLVPGIIEGEVKALLEQVGRQSLAELLEAGGLLAPTRALILRAVDGPAAELFASDDFKAWLDALLDEVL